MNAPLPQLPDPVQWTEGMLLSPQHLQQERCHWQAQLGYRMQTLRPEAWGVRQLELDASALVTGCLSVTLLECVLDDGSVVIHPQPDSTTPLQIDLSQYGAGKPLRVYVVVRRHSDAAAVAGNPERRYDPGSSRLAADENNGDDALPVDTLRLRYELLACDPGAAPPANLGSCALLQVEQGERGRRVIGAYHPPMLCLDASDFLGEAGLRRRFDALVQTMWLKLGELCTDGEAGQPDDESLSGAGQAQREAARLLAGALPLLDICNADPALHPRELYRTLAQAAGMLATLGPQPLPPKLQAYQHLDCAPRFSLLLDYLEQRLTSLRSLYERLRFSSFKEGFARRLLPDMHGELVIELRPRAGQSLAEAEHWLHGAHIASGDLLPVVQAQRQRGARVRRLQPEEARQRRLPADAALFLVHNERIHSANRDAYQAGEPLMIQGSDRSQMPAQIYLYRALQHAAPHPREAAHA